MYVDKSVILPKLPHDLEEDVAELTRLYENDDTFGFLLLEEPVCASVKQAVLDRRLSHEDGLKIFDYFGWR